MKSSVVTAEECLPLFPPLFWLLLPEAGPAEYPERCFLTYGLLKRKTEERHKDYCAGPELGGGTVAVGSSQSELTMLVV